MPHPPATTASADRVNTTAVHAAADLLPRTPLRQGILGGGRGDGGRRSINPPAPRSSLGTHRDILSLPRRMRTTSTPGAGDVPVARERRGRCCPRGTHRRNTQKPCCRHRHRHKRPPPMVPSQPRARPCNPYGYCKYKKSSKMSKTDLESFRMNELVPQKHKDNSLVLHKGSG